MFALSNGQIATLIADQAEAHEASVISRSGNVLFVLVRLRRPSGKIVPYHLTIEVDDPEPDVRETTPTHLPAYCPNRHINGGGYFCLSFPEADPLPIADAGSAADWWKRLLKYLNLQEATSTLRRWPSTHEWAHGRNAALHQGRAERCAAALGPRFVELLGQRRLKAVLRGGAPTFLQLRDGSRRLYSVWVQEKRVATLRQPCLCGSGLPLAACADHAERAAELPLALEAWAREEKRFWDQNRERTCCGGLLQCPLRKAEAVGPPQPPLTARAA